MANTGKTVATLLIGAAIGAAVGYILATDKDTRAENMNRIKDTLKDNLTGLKNKFSKKGQDLEQEIYNS
jgi:gas vesicle protein